MSTYTASFDLGTVLASGTIGVPGEQTFNYDAARSDVGPYKLELAVRPTITFGSLVGTASFNVKIDYTHQDNGNFTIIATHTIKAVSALSMSSVNVNPDIVRIEFGTTPPITSFNGAGASGSVLGPITLAQNGVMVVTTTISGTYLPE